MEKAKTANRYSAEVRLRAVRMVLEHGFDRALIRAVPRRRPVWWPSRVVLCSTIRVAPRIAARRTESSARS